MKKSINETHGEKRNIYLLVVKLIMLPLLIILIFDYYNIPSICGFRSENLNASLLSLLLNTLIVIGLFYITYKVIDEKQLQKDINAKETVKLLMDSTYIKCKDSLLFINDRYVLKNLIIPKVDFNKPMSDEPVVQNFVNNPFIEYDSILQFAASGFVSQKELEQYLEIMRKFKAYVSKRITFFDLEEQSNPDYIELKNKMEFDKRELEELLEKRLTRDD